MPWPVLLLAIAIWWALAFACALVVLRAEAGNAYYNWGLPVVLLLMPAVLVTSGSFIGLFAFERATGRAWRPEE